MQNYTSPWWAGRGHTATLFTDCLRRRSVGRLERHRMFTEDADFFDVDAVFPDAAQANVIILPGMESSSTSPFIQRLVVACLRANCGVMVLNARGCSGESNWSITGYHAGFIDDFHQLLWYSSRVYPQRPLIAIGLSLGGVQIVNAMVSSMVKQTRLLQMLVFISMPMCLRDTTERLSQGFNRVYDRFLLRSLIKNLSRKWRIFPAYRHNIDIALRAKSVHEFDALWTAFIHGFASRDDYYSECSPSNCISGLRLPTLLLHAENDPFVVYKYAIRKICHASPKLDLHIIQSGGHLAFPYRGKVDPVAQFILKWCISHLANNSA